MTVGRSLVIALAMGAVVALDATVAHGEEPSGPQGAFFSEAGTGHSDFVSDLAAHIPHPENTLLVVFGHGASRQGLWQDCPLNIPHFMQLLIGSKFDGLEFVFFRLCSQVRGGRGGDYGVRRAKEVARTVDRFVAHGVPASQIIAAGQSFGASAALIFAARNPSRVNSVIALAPGHGLAKHGRGLSVGNARYRWQSSIRDIAVPTLIYVAEGDDYAPVRDLDFLDSNRFVDLRRIGNPNGGQLCGTDPHFYAFTTCFSTDELDTVAEFLRSGAARAKQ